MPESRCLPGTDTASGHVRGRPTPAWRLPIRGALVIQTELIDTCPCEWRQG